MKIDCHVHTRSGAEYGSLGNYNREKFMKDLRDGGFDGAAIYSPSPQLYPEKSPEELMDICLEMCKDEETLYPFYYIDLASEDPIAQIDLAVKKGFTAFKSICRNHHPGCQKSLDALERIAMHGKAIMFHSGICWDGMDSKDYHKPSSFEALIEIPKLRFCLAHISWPWTDECIAVYGKFKSSYEANPDKSCEMFVDVTPGTPECYRAEVFRHLICTGYEIENHLMFGTDRCTEGYVSDFARSWQEIDNELYAKYYKGDLEAFKANVYGKNFFRFTGVEEPKK